MCINLLFVCYMGKKKKKGPRTRIHIVICARELCEFVPVEVSAAGTDNIDVSAVEEELRPHKPLAWPELFKPEKVFARRCFGRYGEVDL